MADIDAALGEQILDVAQRPRVSHVHHHDQTDDLGRAIEITERVAHGLNYHGETLPAFVSDSTVAELGLLATQEKEKSAKLITPSGTRFKGINR